MTVPARPGLEKLVLTDLPASFAAVERFAVPQLGARVFDLLEAMRVNLPRGLIERRFGVDTHELLLLRWHYHAREIERLACARGLMRATRTHAAATHPEDDDA